MNKIFRTTIVIGLLGLFAFASFGEASAQSLSLSSRNSIRVTPSPDISLSPTNGFDQTSVPGETITAILTAVAPDFNVSPDHLITQFGLGFVTVAPVVQNGEPAWAVTYGGITIVILDENI